MEDFRNERRTLLVLGCAMAASFGLRLANVILYQRYPVAQVLFLDAKVYDRIARTILEGRLLEGGAYYMSPFYSFFLALVYRLFGEGNFLAVRVVQCALGALTPAFVFGIGRRAFGPREGILAAFMLCFYGPHIFYDAMILPTSVSMFLVTAAVYLLLRARSGPGYFASGVVLGLASTDRPNAVLLIPIFALGAYGLHKTRGRGAGLRRAFLAIAGAALVLAPVAARNYLAGGGDRVLISTNGGLNFYIGNNRESQGSFINVDGVSNDPANQLADARRIAERDLGRPLRDSEVSKYWFGRGVSFIRNEPFWALLVYIMKIYVFWNFEEIQLNVNYYFFQRFMPVFAVPFLSFRVIGPLSLLGLFYLFRRGEKAFLLALLAMALAGSVIMFFISGRFRMSVIPLLLPFAAGAVWLVADRLRSGRVWNVLPALAVLAVFAVVGNLDLAGQPTVFSYNTLGTIYMEAGLNDEAEKELLEAYREDPRFAPASFNLAKLARLRDRDDEAVRWYEKSLTASPNEPMVLYGLAETLHHQRRYDEAIDALINLLRVDNRNPQAWNLLGIVFVEIDRDEEARRAFLMALQTRPDFEPARKNLENLTRRLGAGPP